MQIIRKEHLLSFVAPHLSESPVIVEAGTFDGKDTQKLSAFWPQGTIHAFEPVPEIFTLLEKNTLHLSNVIRYPLALSDKTGTASFNLSESPKRPGKPFQAGSLLKPKERLQFSPATYSQTINVTTITLDGWAQSHAIDHVDFLWLDMQGHELSVLKASPQLLSTVKVIYTEVEFIEAYEGQPLYQEVKEWLESAGFVMIAQDFIDQTTWFFGNVVFIKK